MVQVPTRTIDFKSSNSWGIRDGEFESQLSYPRLLHAAITVGHRSSRNRKDMLGEEDWSAEMLWKKSTFEAAVSVESVPHGMGGRTIDRLVQRRSRLTSDPSEKVDLSRQFGMTMTAAWVRAYLGVPWLLHVDVYAEALDIVLPPGEKPDLVGRHADGRWIVVESKGLGTRPTRTQQSRAKRQAGRITDIGGVRPDVGLAILSFPATDRLAALRPKPKVVNTWVIDPPPGEEKPEPFSPEPFSLRGLTPAVFLKLYYGQWLALLRAGYEFNTDGGISWWSNSKVGLRIGIVSELVPILQSEDFTTIPDRVAAAERQLQLTRYPSWSGDGIVVEPLTRF